jgi:hypothetical protein
VSEGLLNTDMTANSLPLGYEAPCCLYICRQHSLRFQIADTMGNSWSQTDMAHLLADTMDNISTYVKSTDLFRPTTLIILVVALYGTGSVRRLFKLRAALAGIGNLPGRRTVCGPYTLLANVLPRIPYINLQAGWQLREKYSREWELSRAQCLRPLTC